VLQITGEQEDAAKGTELLLLATLLQQYCADESEEFDTDILKVMPFGLSRSFFLVLTITGLH
jgi:DNA polymerase phi